MNPKTFLQSFQRAVRLGFEAAPLQDRPYGDFAWSAAALVAVAAIHLILWVTS